MHFIQYIALLAMIIVALYVFVRDPGAMGDDE